MSRDVRFFAAINAGDVKAVRKMIKGAANWQVTSAISSAPFGHEELVKILLARKSNINPDNDRTPLWEAVEANDEVKVRLLLAAGAEPSRHDDERRHVPLSTAVERGSAAIVKRLLD